MFLLACQLSREGFAVTAIEATGVGFVAVEELGAVVLAMAAGDGIVPTIARCKRNLGVMRASRSRSL